METREIPKWTDEMFWSHITVGYCDKCHEGHVLKDGVCWNCRDKEAN